MSIIQGHAKSSGVTAFYPKTIDQSLRFEDGDSANLSRAISTTSNKKTYTLSAWVKLGNLSINREIFTAGYPAYVFIRLTSSDELQISYWTGSTLGYNLITTQLFRDPSAWYHVVVAVDTTQATASNRIKVYINGVQVTSFSTSSYPPLDYAPSINTSGQTNLIGINSYNTNKFDGYMAEVHFTDGTAYTADDFGELRSGIWVPKDVSVTYGTNGFYLDFADGAAIGDDESGNANDWTATNLVASDVVPDSPTNNFAVLNPETPSDAVLSEGNLRIDIGNTPEGFTLATQAVSSGKWYWEYIQLVDNRAIHGIVDADNYYGQNYVGKTSAGYGWYGSTGSLYNNNSAIATYSTYSNVTPDIIAFMLDMDAGELYLYKNGVAENSGSPVVTGLTGTWMPAFSDGSTGDDSGGIVNFGQDSTFAGNKTAGGNSDANGIGDFFYTVPDGALALCTANLPDPAIDPAQEATADQHFNVYTYTGNGASQLIGDVVREIPDTYPISQSLRFEDGDSARLTRTPASAGNQQVFTISTWFKRGNLGSGNAIFGAWTNVYNYFHITFGDGTIDNRIRIMARFGSLSTDLCYVITDASYDDPSAWYHLVVEVDTTLATAADRCKIYINGVLQTLDTSAANFRYLLQEDTAVNNAAIHEIGNRANGTLYFDGYLAEFYLTDGTAYDADTFGVFDADGLWRPIDPSVTYGTNGFHLDFADSADIGDDNSGNTNDWTVNNLVATDVVIDTPTNNFCTLNSVEFVDNSGFLSEGNLKISDTSSANLSASGGTTGMTSGKWYWEANLTVQENGFNIGVVKDTESATSGTWNYTKTNFYAISGIGTSYVSDGSGARNAAGTSFAQGDIVQVAYDADTGKLYFGKNGTWLNSANPAAGTGNLETTSDPKYGYHPVTSTIGDASGYSDVIMNFGQDSTFAGNETAASNTDENGYGEFQYAPPTGFLALCENNLIQYDNNPLESPDWVWIKNREQADSHHWYDSVRGATESLHSDLTEAEVTEPDGLTSFNKNGFVIGSEAQINTSGEDYVAWNWKAGGTAVANTDGSITSTVSANTNAGFSIVSYTGNGTAGATIGHGLDSAPEMIIGKSRDSTASWQVYHEATGATKLLTLNLTAGAATNSTAWNNTEPTSTVFTLGTGTRMNASGEATIAYCFHSVDQHCKVGSYIGNSQADGVFVYTGFKPKWIMLKATTEASTGYTGWLIVDAERMSYNVEGQGTQLWANRNYAEGKRGQGTAGTQPGDIDILSNGFKLRTNYVEANYTGQEYIYLAFAEQPFKYSNAR